MKTKTAQNHAKSAPSDSTSSLEKMINATPKNVGRPLLNNSAMTPNTLKNHKKTPTVRKVK